MTKKQISAEIIINTTPEILYNHLVDFRNHVAWNHQLVQITQTTPDPVQVGTVFHAMEQPPDNMPKWLTSSMMFVLRLLGSTPESRSEITHLVPNEQIEWLAQSPVEGKADMKVAWQLTFTQQGEETHIRQQFQMYPQSRISKIMTNASLKAKIAAGCTDNLGKLKRLMEN